jgi:hypothetical protein
MELQHGCRSEYGPLELRIQSGASLNGFTIFVEDPRPEHPAVYEHVAQSSLESAKENAVLGGPIPEEPGRRILSHSRVEMLMILARAGFHALLLDAPWLRDHPRSAVHPPETAVSAKTQGMFDPRDGSPNACSSLRNISTCL